MWSVGIFLMALPQQNPFLGSAYPQLSTLGVFPGGGMRRSFGTKQLLDAYNFFLVAPGQLNPYLTQQVPGTTSPWQPNLLTTSFLPGTLPTQNIYAQSFLQPQVGFSAPQQQLQTANFIPQVAPPQAVMKATDVRLIIIFDALPGSKMPAASLIRSILIGALMHRKPNKWLKR